MRNGIVLSSLAALGLTGAAVAQDGLSYSYLEASYFNVDEIDLDGFGIKGSYGFSEMIHGFAEYTDGSVDNGGDLTGFEVGLGLNHAINPKVDLIGTVSYLTADADPGSSDSGFGLSGRVRGEVAPAFELEGGINYADFDDAGDNTTFDVGGRYFFTPAFAVGANLEFDDGDNAWTVSLRYNFPNP